MKGQPWSKREPRWGILLGLLLMLNLLCLGGVLFGPLIFPQQGVQAMPVELHSVLQANYQADALAVSLPPANISLMQSAIQDQYSATDAPVRLSTMISDLQTAVPTVTPQFIPVSGSPTPGPRASATVFVIKPTFAPAQPTNSPVPSHPTSAPANPTATNLPTKTSTPVPTALATSTAAPTKVPATAAPPTSVPPTKVPATSVPPTQPPAYPPPQPTSPPPQPTSPPPQPTNPPPKPTSPPAPTSPPQPTSPPAPTSPPPPAYP